MRLACILGFALSASVSQAQGPEARKLFDGAVAEYGQGNYRTALAKFAQACDLQHGEACDFASMIAADLGKASTDAAERSRHEQAAFGFSQQGCKLGRATACSSTAIQAERLGDYALARTAWADACVMKMANACGFAGDMFRSERGGSVDKAKALDFYSTGCTDPEIVASEGGSDARSCLAFRLWKGTEAQAAGDWEAAEEGFLEACDHGIFAACHNAGVAAMTLSNNAGIGEDYKAPMERAKLHFRKACENGVTQSCAM